MLDSPREILRGSVAKSTVRAQHLDNPINIFSASLFLIHQSVSIILMNRTELARAARITAQFN
jgi:hypothetical protein